MPKQLLKGAEFLLSDCPVERIFTPEDFNDEQKQLAETIDQFVTIEVLPNVERMESHDLSLMVKLLKKSGDLGLFMIEAPEEYGGLDLNKATSMLAAEKISGYGSFMVAYMVQTGIGLLPLVYYGTKEQKEKYLGKLISGEWMSAYCLTEPDSGSDALGAKTTATLSSDGKHYVLNGTKQFITNGGFADLFTVFAKVDRKQFTAFLVERSPRGLSTGPEEKKLGIRGSSTTQVIFEDVNIPVENVLGEIGKGHKIAFNVLNIGRLKLGAAATGAAKTVFIEGVKYANVRKQFGVPISSFGAIKEKIADMVAAIFASESLVYRLAGMIDDRLANVPKGSLDYYDAYQQGIEEYAIECAMAKVFCSEMLGNVVDDVVQIHGGYGFVEEYPAERYYRDERANRIFEGTNEINRILITGTLLKRAMKGEIPFVQEVKKAREVLASQSSKPIDASLPFAAEKVLLKNLKHAFLTITGAAVDKFGDRIKDEQMVLMTLADVAINIFAIESVVLRGEKINLMRAQLGNNLVNAVVKVFAFNAVETIATAARKAAFYIDEGKPLEEILRWIEFSTKYDASHLLHAKNLLAETTFKSEKYLF
jgi:alkylation response protein AidB-like acyl-CoA dehydrogenase